MKKLFILLFALAVGTGAMHANELLNIDFTKGQGDWTIENKDLGGLDCVWQQSSTYGMMATGYVNGNHATESWLISPIIDFSDVVEAQLDFSHARKYGDLSQLSVRASSDGSNWTTLEVNVWPDGSSWDYIESTAYLSEFEGKSDVRIAFVYTSTDASGSTWEIKSVSVKGGLNPTKDPNLTWYWRGSVYGEEAEGEFINGISSISTNEYYGIRVYAKNSNTQEEIEYCQDPNFSYNNTDTTYCTLLQGPYGPGFNVPAGNHVLYLYNNGDGKIALSYVPLYGKTRVGGPKETTGWVYRKFIGGLGYNLNISTRTAEVTYASFSGGPGYLTYAIDSVVVPETIGYDNITCDVTRLGKYAFGVSESYSSNTIKSITLPNSIQEIDGTAFTNSSASVYVPCGELERFRNMGHGNFRNIPSPYTITAKESDGGFVQIPTYSICDDQVVVTAEPMRGFHFVKWADENTENPRTLALTQDIALEAVFNYDLTGKCGKDNALTWELNPLTMALNISGVGELTDNYTYSYNIQSVNIGNEITIIGEYAFAEIALKNITIGASVKVIESRAFEVGYDCTYDGYEENCVLSLSSITCYGQRPPTIKANAFGYDDLPYSTIVYVPADYVATYKAHDFWGVFDIRPIGATSVQTTEVQVSPDATTADVVWPTVPGAVTYELVIRDKEGNVVCTLIFNAQGQLMSIAFNAPARGDAPQQTQTAGFAFTVTGLESGKAYDYTLTAKNEGGTIINTQSGSFITKSPQGIDDVEADSKSTKILRDGQVFIQKGEKTYTVTGQEVK